MIRMRISLVLLAAIATSAIPVFAADADSCLQQGRAHLFEGTVSGLRDAYNTFDGCLDDPDCIDCNDSRELKFLHAVTRVIMWVARDDGQPIDSAIEIAEDFGFGLLGDHFTQLDITNPDYPAASYGTHDMPAETPDVSDFKAFAVDELWPPFVDFIDNSAIPEIDALLAELESIGDSPSDPFRIFFYPHETRLGKTIEVDYGEVLLLKGALTYIKALIHTRIAYDLYIDSNDMLIEKAYAGDLNLSDDILSPYPHLLKILPTINDPNDGNEILAQAKGDLIAGIDYCFLALDYILTEDDPQADDVLYIDPRDYEALDEVLSRLRIIKNSLLDDTSITHPRKTQQNYTVMDVNSAEKGNLSLVHDAFGGVRGGSFLFQIDQSTYSDWEIESFHMNDSVFLAELEMYNSPGTGGILAGIISADKSKITEMTFEYWGIYVGSISQLSANLSNQTQENVEFDLNPIYGGTSRYPNPVSPRDLLPQFDSWNYPLPGTLAWALGNDGTFGGLAPGMTQRDWQIISDLQPGGLVYLDFISPGQVIVDGAISDWTTDQLVFEDISGDGNSSWPGGVDIENFYLAYDSDSIYVATSLYDSIETSDPSYAYQFTVYMSYDLDEIQSKESIKFEITVSQSNVDGQLYSRRTEPWGYSYWEPLNSFESAAGSRAIEFKVPFASLPGHLPGRFISVDSELKYNGWIEIGGEQNHTHLQIGEIGNISGTVLLSNETDYQGVPIIVQAYTDDSDPEGTMVSSTVIKEPGPYMIEGVGLGWQGWVRAFSSCYNFNEAGVDSQQIETITPVFVWQPETTGVDLVLPACSDYLPGVVEIAVGVPYNGSLISQNQDELWHHFIADSDGVFSVTLTGDFGAFLGVYDDLDGHKLIGSSNPDLKINVQAGKHYYVLADRIWGEGNYTLTVSHFGPPVLNDDCSNATEVITGVTYNGSTVGCIGDDITECGNGDDYDVWHTFTAGSDGVYQIELTDSISATLAIFDSCGGKQILCKEPWQYPGPAYLNASAGFTYLIRIAGGWKQTGDYSLTISYFSSPLINDQCANAVELFGGVTESGSNYGALDDDVWYKFIPAQDGVYEVNVIDMSSDIDVFDDCDGNEVPTGYSSKPYFAAEMSKTYTIRLERSPWSQPDNFTIDVSYLTSAVENDHRQDALQVEPNNSYPGNTAWATQDGISSCGWDDKMDVWYVFTPQNSGVYSVELTDADFSAGLSVFEEGWPLWLDEISEILCKDAFSTGPSYFYGKAGSEYYFRVAGYGYQTGSFTFNLGKISERAFLIDVNSDGIVDHRDLARMMDSWLASCPQPYKCDGCDFDFNNQVDFVDLSIMANEWMGGGLP